jgi:hypothetical protein
MLSQRKGVFNGAISRSGLSWGAIVGIGVATVTLMGCTSIGVGIGTIEGTGKIDVNCSDKFGIDKPPTNTVVIVRL